MLIEHRGRRPQVDPTAWIAPNATLSGAVRIGPGSRILYGALSPGTPGSALEPTWLRREGGKNGRVVLFHRRLQVLGSANDSLS